MTARGLLARLKRLESRPGLRQPYSYQIGVLKRLLPADYVGQRHFALMESSPRTGLLEFEERPGPAPPGCEDHYGRIILTEAEATS
jgi:hypothetical protein